MPWLDPSSVLLSPFFNDNTLAVYRNEQVVNQDGIASLISKKNRFNGVVTMANGMVLSRLAEGERLNTTITVHTKFNLIDGKSGFTADIISWRGTDWTVMHVNPYSTYGGGFHEAICEMRTLQGADL